MNRKGKLLIIITVLAITSIIVLEYIKPKELNWFPSYAAHHKIPFGTYVFNEQLKRIFLEENVEDVYVPPFEQVYDNPDIEGTYVFVNDNVRFGKQELNRLLDWVSQGNSLVLASSNIEQSLLDTLHLSTARLNTFNNLEQDYYLKLKNKKLDTSLYHFDRSKFAYYFNEIDTLNTLVAGVIDNANEPQKEIKIEHVNFIQQPFGKGEIILSLFPEAFTNYFILKSPNQKYLSGVISYLNADKPIFLDHYYKTGKTYYSSPLYIVLNKKELKWAYYILLIGAIIYVIFEGKRKQRAIPIIPPLTNKTLDFTRTIANMYYEKGKHKEISVHKIQHFLEYIRTHLYLNTAEINDSFLKNLAARSNNSLEDTQKLFKLINSLEHKATITQNELEILNKSIDDYKMNNSWKKTKN